MYLSRRNKENNNEKGDYRAFDPDKTYVSSPFQKNTLDQYKEDQLKYKTSDESKIRFEWEITDRLIKKLRYVSPSGVKVYLAISSLIILKDDEIKITYSMLRERTNLDISTIFLAVRELVAYRLITNSAIDGYSAYSLK